MIITTDQSTAANAAITDLQTALATWAGLGSPSDKDNFRISTIYPLVTGASALCLTLGNTLAEELNADADAALAPFETGDFRRTQIVIGLLAVRSIAAQTNALQMACNNPAVADNSAQYIITIFQTVLAVIAAQAAEAAAIVTAVQAALTALGGGAAQAAIVGAAVQAALVTAGEDSDLAAAAGAAVQAALAA